eukprot:TRINITY_DN17049_c0_g1_i1.p1 TRINITY_DN17049_c0_g1~~TRINITY_DN17049_c0_g1_i1.p1  ORF type:complete len:644 (+),score=86.42 TRINITY_DN17049_c0_g1_i1:67-1998(+)
MRTWSAFNVLALWITCSPRAASTEKVPDIFMCPPMPRNRNRAHRVPLDDNLFLPIFASVPPGKRSVVCELDKSVYIRSPRSGKYVAYDGERIILAEQKMPFKLLNAGSYASTVRIASAESSSQWLHGGTSPGDPVLRKADKKKWEQNWEVTEASSGQVFLTSFMFHSLHEDDEERVTMVESAPTAGWEITKADGSPACSFVEPTTAIIDFPGAWRETEWHVHDMGRLVFHRERVKGSTVVINLAFGDKECSAEQWAPHQAGSGQAVMWSKIYMWIFGANPDSKNAPNSLEAVDKAVDWTLASYKKVGLLVVNGFSAGGVIGLRWAIMSTVGAGGVYEKPGGGKVQVRIVLGGLGSYEYFNKKRPTKNCTEDHWPKQPTTACHRCTSFVEPAESCSDSYDKYPYGYEGLEGEDVKDKYSRLDAYMKKKFAHAPKLQRFAADGRPFVEEYHQELAANFASKDVRFNIGGHDLVSCHHGTCSGACAEMLQGSNRLQRALNYMGHLREVIPNYVPVYGVYFNPEFWRHYHYGSWMSRHYESWVFIERPGLTAERKGPPKWHHKKGKFCWKGRGAAPLLERHDVCHTVATCTEKCEKDPYCKGFAMQSKASDGFCWLYSQIDLDRCQDNDAFTLHFLEASTDSKTIQV